MARQVSSQNFTTEIGFLTHKLLDFNAIMGIYEAQLPIPTLEPFLGAVVFPRV